MLFDINEKVKTMTREEFLNEMQIDKDGVFNKFFHGTPFNNNIQDGFSCSDVCPSIYGLKEFCGLSSDSCKDCWTKAVKPIKFKDDENK